MQAVIDQVVPRDDFISSMLMEVFWFGSGMPFPFSFFLLFPKVCPHLPGISFCWLFFSLFVISPFFYQTLLYSSCTVLVCVFISRLPLTLLSPFCRLVPGPLPWLSSLFVVASRILDIILLFPVYLYSRERSIWIRVLASRLLVTNEVLLIATGYWMLTRVENYIGCLIYIHI